MEMAGAGPGSAAVDAVGAVAEVADADSAGAERGPLLQPIKVFTPFCCASRRLVLLDETIT
jgi:hypothetical protein